MGRLIKNFRTVEAKPRKKKKELKLTTKFVFEVFSDDDMDAKGDLKTFRNWMRDEFPKWSQTILEHFLYQNNLSQTVAKPKYLLAVNVDKIIKDESSITDERKYFDSELQNLSIDAEENIRKQEEKMFAEKDIHVNSPKTIIEKRDNTKVKVRKD